MFNHLMNAVNGEDPQEDTQEGQEGQEGPQVELQEGPQEAPLGKTQGDPQDILLVLPFEEISLRPELSSPPRFRAKGGRSPERDGRKSKRRKSLCLILDIVVVNYVIISENFTAAVVGLVMLPGWVSVDKVI